MPTLDAASWGVIAGGTAAIVWVNWYFFLAERSVATAATTAGAVRQEVTVTVRGGYDPAVVRAKAGVPLRLVFDRQETSSCSEELVFPEFGVRRFLPAHQLTAVDVTPPAPGSYEFTCGMGMLRGRVVAE